MKFSDGPEPLDEKNREEMGGSKDLSERRKELAKLAGRPISAGRLSAASHAEDLKTPLEVLSSAAGVTEVERRRAACHPYDPVDYLVTLTLVAEGDAAARQGTGGVQLVACGSLDGCADRIKDRAELLELGKRDYAALMQQALLAGVSQPELRMAREHRYDGIGYLVTLILVAQQENRHEIGNHNPVATRRISTRVTGQQQLEHPSWIVERLLAEGITGLRGE